MMRLALISKGICSGTGMATILASSWAGLNSSHAGRLWPASDSMFSRSILWSTLRALMAGAQSEVKSQPTQDALGFPNQNVPHALFEFPEISRPRIIRAEILLDKGDGR